MKTLIPLALVLALVACAPVPENVTNNTTVFPIPSEIAPVDTETQTTQPAPAAPAELGDDFAAHLTFTEGDLIRLKSLAVDPDQDKVTLSFSEPFDQNGLWQTKIGDAGDYPVTVVATDSKGASVSQRVLVTIKNANRAPSIIGPSRIDVKEGELVSLDFSAQDPDNNEAIISYSGWMKGSTYQTTYADAGDHEVTVTAEDGKTVAKKVVTVHVENVNQPPVIVLDRTAYAVTELQPLTVKATASDPDGDSVTLSFSAPLNAQGTWTPQLEDAGDHEVMVSATDGVDTTTQVVTISVGAANRAPRITVPTQDGILHFKEGDLIDLRTALVVTDQEGEEVAVRFSGWMRSAVYQTGFEDAGRHEVTVDASDDFGHAVTQTVVIIVDDVNRPPVFVQPA